MYYKHSDLRKYATSIQYVYVTPGLTEKYFPRPESYFFQGLSRTFQVNANPIYYKGPVEAEMRVL